MTEQAFAEAMKKPETGFDVNDPANVAPLVVWLASAQSAHVTGQVFEVKGGLIMLAQGWRDGPTIDKGERWRPRRSARPSTGCWRNCRRRSRSMAYRRGEDDLRRR
ncbi:MAG: hypothetical protein WDN69_14245 [Aliidongia sp.]